jgi:hypothetical protein
VNRVCTSSNGGKKSDHFIHTTWINQICINVSPKFQWMPSQQTCKHTFNIYHVQLLLGNLNWSLQNQPGSSNIIYQLIHTAWIDQICINASPQFQWMSSQQTCKHTFNIYHVQLLLGFGKSKLESAKPTGSSNISHTLVGHQVRAPILVSM